MKDFAENLKSYRIEHNYSLEDLAKILETSRQVLSRYETRQRIPKITVISEYAEKLNVPLLYFLTGSGNSTELALADTGDSKLNELHKALLNLILHLPKNRMAEAVNYLRYLSSE